MLELMMMILRFTIFFIFLIFFIVVLPIPKNFHDDVNPIMNEATILLIVLVSLNHPFLIQSILKIQH